MVKMPNFAADDFEAIRTNLEKIKKEEQLPSEQSKGEQPAAPFPTHEDDYYGCGYNIEKLAKALKEWNDVTTPPYRILPGI
jgi:hypothetical protein